MYVNSDYNESVLNNSGIPTAIPAVPKADPEGILAVCDEFWFGGGLKSVSYGIMGRAKTADQTIRPEIDEAWFALDGQQRWECPLLGSICKGIQFLMSVRR